MSSDLIVVVVVVVLSFVVVALAVGFWQRGGGRNSPPFDWQDPAVLVSWAFVFVPGRDDAELAANRACSQ